MKKRITLLSVFICLFMLCTAMFAVTTVKANADGETYTLTFETPMANDYDIASSASTWHPSYKTPVLNDEGGLTLTKDASEEKAQYGTKLGKYSIVLNKTYVAVISVKTDSNIRFILQSMSPNYKWIVVGDGWYNSADYVDYRVEFTPTEKEGNTEFIFQILGGSGNIYVKNFKVYEKSEVTVNGGVALGEQLPAVPEKSGYAGTWTIDGVAIDKDTVYDYGADKTAVVTYTKLNMLTFVSESYNYNMASSLENWITPATNYQVPVLNDEGGVTLTRGDDETVEQLNYAIKPGYDVTSGTKYIIEYKVKGSGRFNFAWGEPGWKSFADNTYNSADAYIDVKYEYTATGNGKVVFFFQMMKGKTNSANICVKDFRFYTTTERTFTEEVVIGELPAITAKAGYVSYWTIDGEKITADTLYNYGTDKTAVVVSKKINTIHFLKDVYDGDLVTDLSAWTTYETPTLGDDGSAVLNRPEGTSGALNYLVGTTHLPVEKDKNYLLVFYMKCDYISMRIATNGPTWNEFDYTWYNNADYVRYEFDYTAPKDGFATIIFQSDAGSGNVYVKDLKLYEKIADDITVIEDDKYGVLPSLEDMTVKHGYRLAWTIDGEEITADTVCKFTSNQVAKISELALDGHTVSEVAEVASTCEDNGVKHYYDCTCGKHFADADGLTEITDLDAWKAGDGKINAKGHTYNDGVVTTEPTCTEKGVKTFTCTVCEHTKTEDVNAKGHSAVEAWTNDETNHWHECANGCGEKLDETAHTYNDGVVTTEPTCTEKGVKTFTCTACGHTKTEDVNAKGHSAVEAWTNDETNHWHECANGCGEKLDETAHTYNDGVVTTEPTCTAKGVKTFTCTVCEHTKTEDVNAKGHSAVEAWTNDETNHWHECANGCGEKLDETAHTYNDGVVTTEPTCTEKGVKTFTCTACGQTKTEDVNAKGHSAVETWSKDETNHWHVCAVCGEKLEETAHTYNDGEVTTEPTCTEDGEKTYTCTVCGHTKTETVEKTGHVDGDNDGVCDACGEKLKKDKGCNLSVSGMACIIAIVAVFAVVIVAKGYRKE